MEKHERHIGCINIHSMNNHALFCDDLHCDIEFHESTGFSKRSLINFEKIIETVFLPEYCLMYFWMKSSLI